MEGNKRTPLTASEAVYGFAAWLTCRTEVIKIGASENVSPLPTLVRIFCDANGLAYPTENYPHNLIHPRGDEANVRDDSAIPVGYQRTIFDDLRDECERHEELLEQYKAIPTGAFGAIIIQRLIHQAKDILGRKDQDGAKYLLREMKETN